MGLEDHQESAAVENGGSHCKEMQRVKAQDRECVKQAVGSCFYVTMRICSKEIEICTYLYIYIEIAAVFFSSVHIVHSFKQHEAAGLNLEKLDQV